jgi:hypothetical protein
LLSVRIDTDRGEPRKIHVPLEQPIIKARYFNNQKSPAKNPIVEGNSISAKNKFKWIELFPLFQFSQIERKIIPRRHF